MASQKLSTMEQLWTFRSSFPDSWISESFTRDAEILTKALQNSLSANSQGDLTSDSMSGSLLTNNQSIIPATPAVSGSDQRTVTKRDRINNNVIPVTNSFTKVSKRKSRASKRSQTTFITADPANFRRMVQEVTGVRFGSVSGEEYVDSIVKPEAQRVGGVRRFEEGGVTGCCLPTLDTSASLLDYERQKQRMEVGPIMNGIGDGPESSSSVVGLVGVDDVDFDAFASFPTLESWKLETGFI